MGALVNGVLVPPVDAGTIDGIPANLTPAGAGQDGYVVTFSNANGDLELLPSSGGFANPMTAAGDTIVGGDEGAATALHVGPTGFVYRVVGGTPVWRGLCAEGTGAARPTAAEQYVGQWYWSNDAAAGLELAVCVFEGGVTYAWVTVPYGVTAAGTSLPTASGAGQVPVSDGAGSAYTATSAGDVLALGMVAALTGEPAGAALISDGLGGVTETSADVSAVLAAADAAALRAILDATRTTTPSLASTSGWTNSTSGSGATSIQNTVDGRMEFGINANSGTGRAVRTIAVPSDYWAQVRVRSMSDTTVDVLLTLTISAGGAEGPRFSVFGNGALRALYTQAATGSVTVRAQTSAITAVRSAMTAGTLWLRVQSHGGIVSYWYAIGATEASLAWLLFAAYTMPGTGDGERRPDDFNVGLGRNANSGAQTATVDSISYRDLSP